MSCEFNSGHWAVKALRITKAQSLEPIEVGGFFPPVKASICPIFAAGASLPRLLILFYCQQGLNKW